MPRLGGARVVTKPVSTRAWQRMLSGRRLDLLDPRPEDVSIEDIAHGLARVARWNGQTLGPHIFSVAQHSLLVEAVFSATEARHDPAKALVALLHDAAEYVVGDLISPFKAALGQEYKAVEERVLAAVHARFGLTEAAFAAASNIKAADRAAARLEATVLAGFAEAEATLFFGSPDPVAATLQHRLGPLQADEASALFLQRFDALERSRAP